MSEMIAERDGMSERVLALDRLCDRMAWLDEAITDAMLTGVLTVRDMDNIKRMRDALDGARAYCKEAVCAVVSDAKREAHGKEDIEENKEEIE